MALLNVILYDSFSFIGEEMKIILWILIILAVILIVARRIKNIKKGKFCDCGCESCLNKCKEFKE